MPDQPLQISSATGKTTGTRILTLTGPLTLTNLFEFQSMVRSDESNSLIVDLRAVPYVDSAGIGCLVGGHVSHQRDHRQFVLAGVTDRVRTVLKVCGVETVLTIFSTVEEAEASAAGAGAA